MLNEYKQLYQESAKIIPDYHKQTISQLCYEYEKQEQINGPLKDNYLSAIIIKGWSLPTQAFYAQEVKGISEEDMYDIYIEALMQILSEKAWNNPGSTIYNDKNGPEKALRVAFKCRKVNFIVALQRQKRKLNYTSYSLEELSEDKSDQYYLPAPEPDYALDSFLIEIIHKYCEDGEYEKGIILDIISNNTLLKTIDDTDTCEFSEKKLKKFLKNLDERYCNSFANVYNTNKEEVLNTISELQDLSYTHLTKEVSRMMRRLARDKSLVEFLQD